MIEKSLAQSYSQVVNILIFIFPIVVISLQVVGDIVLFILAMMGVFIAISQKLSPFKIQEIKVFSYLGIGYFIVICLSVLFSGQPQQLAHYIPREFYFLFAPFISLAFFKAEININYLIVGVKVSLLVLGMIVIGQLLSGTLLSQRPSGLMNSIVFGNLSVSLFFTALIFFQNESFKYKILTISSLLSGLFIIIASGSRGAWLSFLFMLGLYLYFFYKKKALLQIRYKFFIVAIIASIVSFGMINTHVKERVYSVYEVTSSLILDEKTPSSSEMRYAMYRKAIKNIEEVPFFGYGLRTSNNSLFQNDSSALGRVLSRYNHLHNAYLTNYYNGGILLLVALLLLLFLPLRIFLKARSQNHENPVFIAGALLTLGYASFGMVNILFGDTYMNGFYVFFLAIFLLLTNKSIKAP